MSPHQTSPSLREVLGGNVRSLRHELNMSQEQLAEAAGLTQVFVSRIESASVAATIDTLEKLSVGLNCVPGQLLDRRK